ncbi:carboxylate-amine ligase [Armatimonas rosea]|uniref:Putative glutamate--cysteine ligase 2 n=1 Tax=Armatimonas rosea TaxID=685828 RepID=A0A7W9STA9_ARMRO|nr:carboxylate-amine ligase [Armatimonas rosea]MBB6051554.1 carboxylate-amine ligase [Armatimonas rosea]
MPTTFNIGIEEEYQTIDPETRDLRSHIGTELLPEGKRQLQESVKAEMHQSVVEVGTGVCDTVRQARDELYELRQTIIRLAENQGLKVAAAGTHPFANWREQEIYPDARYDTIVDDLQQVARENLIFGLHVHVGIPDKEARIRILNSVRYFLPHILALSTNSPFWLGYDTGLKSYRCKVFDKFPRTNIPDAFSSWAEFESYVDLLIKTGCIDNAKKIWWDVRPHPFFPTIEFRICDVPLRIDETIALTALMQATVAKLHKLHTRNQDWRVYSRALLMENKWRALRYGVEGKLIDFGKQEEVPFRDLMLEYLAFVDDVVDELGCRRELGYVQRILERGTGADRQLRVFKESGGDLKAVVDYMVAETQLPPEL